MLVIARTQGERIVVDGPCVVTVCRIGRDVVRIGVEADKDVAILRAELADEERKDTDSTDDGSPR